MRNLRSNTGELTASHPVIFLSLVSLLVVATTSCQRQNEEKENEVLILSYTLESQAPRARKELDGTASVINNRLALTKLSHIRLAAEQDSDTSKLNIYSQAETVANIDAETIKEIEKEVFRPRELYFFVVADQEKHKEQIQYCIENSSSHDKAVPDSSFAGFRWLPIKRDDNKEYLAPPFSSVIRHAKTKEIVDLGNRLSFDWLTEFPNQIRKRYGKIDIEFLTFLPQQEIQLRPCQIIRVDILAGEDPHIHVEFDADGSKRLSQLTSRYQSYHIGIATDDSYLGTYYLNEPIVRRMMIYGYQGIDDLFDLVDPLRQAVYIDANSVKKSYSILKQGN